MSFTMDVKFTVPLHMGRMFWTYVTHQHQMRHTSHTKVLSKWQNKEK